MPTCPNRIDGLCVLANRFVSIIGLEPKVQCRDDAFAACAICACPHTDNHVVASLAISFAAERGVKDSTIHEELLALGRGGQECDPSLHFPPIVNSDCGDVLHANLKRKGFEITPDCPCKDMIAKMNLYGSVWAIRKIDNIAKSMVAEAKKRGLRLAKIPLAPQIAARSMILRALQKCSNAKLPQLQKLLILSTPVVTAIITALTFVVRNLYAKRKLTGQLCIPQPVKCSNGKVTGQGLIQLPTGQVDTKVTGQKVAYHHNVSCSHVYVIGYPSDVGGADTELLHTVGIWRRAGLGVTLVPTWGPPEPRHRSRCDDLGCETMLAGPDKLRESIPEGATVVSFCNGGLLDVAPTLHSIGCKIVWVGCMCWPFDKEKEYYTATKRTFDAYVFQSQYQRSQLEPTLMQYEGYNVGRGHLIHGAFDMRLWNAEGANRESGDPFVIGRLARADCDKWSSNTWSIYSRIRHSNKAALMLGVDAKVAQKLGPAPEWAGMYAPGAIPSTTFFRQLHCLLPINGGAKENWPRAGLEALASGVPIVAQNEWGWREMITHGVTGFLASTDDELAEYANELAEDETLRRRIGKQGKEFLTHSLANEEKISLQWLGLFEKVQR